MRLGETSTLFRNEDSGEMHGLIRVRQFTISEGHLVLRPDQLEEEFKGCLELTKYMLDTVGLLDKCTFRFSQWDPANPNNKYEGTAEQWNEAQRIMGQILDHLGVEYTIGIDEAAFYGPKLDIQYKNVYGKEDTLVTIQIDMLLAERFGMYYTDKDGSKKLPYIIHRTSLGCYERTLAYLLETYAGALPTWMAPEQVRILTITDRAAGVCRRHPGKAERRRFPRHRGRQRRDPAQEDPQRPDGEDPLHGHPGRQGHGKSDRVRPLPQRRRPGLHVLRGLRGPAARSRGQQGKEISTNHRGRGRPLPR